MTQNMNTTDYESDDSISIISIRSNTVYQHIIQIAAKRIRLYLNHGHTKALNHENISQLPKTTQIKLLGGNMDEEDEEMDDETRDELANEEPFIVQVKFVQEVMGWSSVVYKVIVSELNNQQPTEEWAVKLRVGNEESNNDNKSVSNKRAYNTMTALHATKHHSLVPEPIFYIDNVIPVPVPEETYFTRPIMDHSTLVAFPMPLKKPDKPLPKHQVSVLICSWLIGISPGPLNTNLRNKSTLRAWTRLLRVHSKISSIKKPKLGDRKVPKYNHLLQNVFDLNDHDLWLHNSESRIHGLEYILQNKIDQNILPKSLKFLTNVDNTGLIFLKGIGYRLKACLNRLKAMKRDGEDQQDMVLCIGDPSLDNIIVGTNISTGGLKISLVDLESSGWTDPAYSIAQFLTCNVWCDKTGMLEQNDMFPFEPSFESFIVSIFIENFEWSKNESKFKIFLERLELNKEFCAIKGLLFHIRGVLHGLGDMIDGFRRTVDTSGSASGSGGGATLGGGALSPGKLKSMMYGEKRPKGRASSTLFGKQVLFERTHIESIAVYMKLLERSNYMRRVVGEHLEMHVIIDEIRAQEKKLADIEDKRLRREHRIRCGLENDEEEVVAGEMMSEK